jgi:hypothetical protein
MKRTSVAISKIVSCAYLFILVTFIILFCGDLYTEVHILLVAISTRYHSKLRDVKFLAADLQTEELHARIGYHLSDR